MKILFRFLRSSRRNQANNHLRTLWLTLLVSGIVVASQQRVNGASTTADGATVEKFTGGHTRVVWLTDAENKDSFAVRDQTSVGGL